MNHAKNNPVNKPGRELDSRDIAINQRAEVNLDLPDEQEEIALADDSRIEQHYLQELAFMEEPVTIQIPKSQEKRAPNVVDCWVNGRGAEQFINGRWMVCGWLPVGQRVITKRKYLEVLASAKHDSVETKVIQHEGYEDNKAIINSSGKYAVQVLEDKNPQGAQWFSRIVSLQ